MSRVTLGHIAGVYGVKGWMKIRSYSVPPENILTYRRWFLHGRGEYKAQVLEGKNHGTGVVVQLSGPDGMAITDRDVAAQWVGAEIQVAREDLPKLKPGEYYWVDLVGLEVSSVHGAALGKVETVTDNGAQAVLVLRDGEQQRLIPFVHGPIIRSVDLKAGRIVADWDASW
jgi:16S rRNA processing protein RimM